MVMFIGTECPECGEKAVFLQNKMIEIDGEMCGPMSAKCDSCGWEPSDEEVIKHWKQWIAESEEEMNKMERVALIEKAINLFVVGLKMRKWLEKLEPIVLEDLTPEKIEEIANEIDEEIRKLEEDVDQIIECSGCGFYVERWKFDSVKGRTVCPECNTVVK